VSPLCTQQRPWGRRATAWKYGIHYAHVRTQRVRQVRFGAVRAQAVVVTDKIVWECCRDRFVYFFIFLSIPRRRRRRRCTRAYRHPAPDRRRSRAAYVLTVECTCARACNRRCTREIFFLRLSRSVLNEKNFFSIFIHSVDYTTGYQYYYIIIQHKRVRRKILFSRH